MAETRWTPSLVEERFVEAASVMKRLPGVRVPGYFNTWPSMMREFADLVGQEPCPMRLPPPSAGAITRMEETLDWLRWLDADDARIVWMRATGERWKAICWKVGVARHGCQPALALRALRRRLEAQRARTTAPTLTPVCH